MGLSASSRLLKALSDETRMRILNLLEREELSGTDLMEILNMGQSRISTHLTLLKDVGLVVDRRAGRRSFYSLVPGKPRSLWERIRDENAGAPEFATDAGGLEALWERNKAESQAYFDRVAASFTDQILPGRTWEGYARALLKLAPAKRYADLGIGDGLLSMMLAEVADTVTAVDISKQMLAQLRQKAKAKGIDNIVTVEGEIEDVPLEDGSHDVVVLSQALHHAERPEKAISEAFRILAAGGRVLVIDLLAHTEEWVQEKLQHRQLGFTEAKLKRLLAESGFDDVVVQRAARDPQPPHFMTLVATGSKP